MSLVCPLPKVAVCLEIKFLVDSEPFNISQISNCLFVPGLAFESSSYSPFVDNQCFPFGNLIFLSLSLLLCGFTII